MKIRITGLLCLALTLGCEQQPESKVEFRTATVEERDIVVVVESAGVIQPFRTIEVKSKASGEILSIHAETGDFVEESSLLVQIDKRSPRNQLALVESQREAALARQAIADAQHDRAEQLFKSRSINEVDYENTVLERANSKAEVVRSQVSIENARFALDDTEVNAPITGTVIEKLVEKGQVISSPISDVGGGTVLMKMADLRTMQVQALVNEIDIGKIRKGQSVIVTVTSHPNAPFRGEVLKVEPQALPEQAVTSFPVIITLQNQDGLLRPGMNADVEIFVEQRHQVVTVPNAAMRTMRDIEVTASLVGFDVFDLRNKLEQLNPEPRPVDGSASEADNGQGVSPGAGLNNRFWVLVNNNGSFEPKYVETGITDLDYSEVLAGLDVGAEVLLLPSSGMVKTQQRTQQQLSRISRLTGISQRSD
jgi:HlyD family secretion protein